MYPSCVRASIDSEEKGPLLAYTTPESIDAGCQELVNLGCDQRQSTSPVRLGWCRISGTLWPRWLSKAIDLARLTRVAQDTKCCVFLPSPSGIGAKLVASLPLIL